MEQSKVKPRLKILLIHTFLLMSVVITVFPLIRILGVSLKPQATLFSTSAQIFPPLKDITFENYTSLFKNTYFLKWLLNSLIITILTSLVGVIIAASAAYAFSRFRFPGRRTGLWFLIATQMIPGTMFLLPLYIIITKLGLVNSYLGLVIGYSTTALPFTIWTLKGYFDTIPVSIEESAQIDGASYIRIFYQIILPLSIPALGIAFLFNFTSAWNEYLLARIILNEPSMYTWTIGLAEFQGNFKVYWGVFSAASIVVTVPILILFLYSAKWLLSGLTLGAVK